MDNERLEMMNTREAAAYLHISPDYLRELCRNNLIPCKVMSPFNKKPHYLFVRSLLDRWACETSYEFK